MAKQLPFELAVQWLSRTIAILIFMVGPGLLGTVIDKRLNVSVFTPIGFLLGITLAMTALIVLSKKLTPPAGGKPLAMDEDEETIAERESKANN